ncbi:multidrug and toxin extrusion protein 1 [Diplocarpon mali]|nr:multidrug and toxin extrusion protein 1 [Diplocarpon mali]
MEDSPLLCRSASTEFQKNAGKKAQKETTWKKEAKIIATWSAPLIATTLLQRSIIIVSIFAVGRIGTIELGAVTVASATTNMIGNTVIQGLANGLDTLAAQAYGSGKKHLVGLHVQRMIYFIHLCVLPLIILWWKAEEIFVFILKDQQVAYLAGTYLKIMILRFPAYVLFECGKRFFQAQGIFHAATFVVVLAAPFNALIMWLFVWHLGWGFIGAPIAIVITENLMVLLLLLYAWLVDGSQCWGGLTKDAFRNWGPMIRIAVPGMIMYVTEFAAEEVLTLAAAQFGTSQLAAQSVLVTLVQITYIVPLGASIAASIRVANWIGARASGAAKFSAKVVGSSPSGSLVLVDFNARLQAVVFGFVLSSSNTVLLFSLRNQLPYLFTRDPEVVVAVVKSIPIISCMLVFDTMAAFSHGLLRAIGCQGFGSYVNLVAYYVIALPISFSTAFMLDWKIYGLWTGMATGLCLVSTIEFWWLNRSDWDHAVDKATLRNDLG